jgi:uncharacterized membrane protein YfcA
MSIGATLQGAAGYGMALVAGPVLMLIEPDLIPGPMVISAFLLVILVIFRDRQALDFLGLKWAVIGFIPGVALGIFFLKRFSGEQFATLFALLILLVVLMSAVGLRFKANKPTLTIAGFSAGLMSVLTTTSGPPIALVYQDAPGKKLRATISGFFVAGTIFVVSSLLLVGELGVRELSLSLLLIPGILVGFLASRRVANWVDRGYTRPVVLLISGLSAIVVLINQLWR